MEIRQTLCHICAYEEDGKIMELRFEPVGGKSSLGNIYVGQIENIAANIGAAFVQISAGERCYLQLSDASNAIYTSVRKGDRPLNRQLRICCKIPTSTGTAENTASAAKLTIPVGTGHSSVQSHLINFFSEPFPKHMIQRMIRLSIPVLLLCHRICIHTSVPSLFCSSFSSFGI